VSSAIPIVERAFFRPAIQISPSPREDAEKHARSTPRSSYPLPFWSGFFEKKHYQAMGGGPAFLFGYLVDKTTKENCGDDGKMGIVLGGKPIRDTAIAKHYDISLKTVARFREILIREKYIQCQRTPYGYRYTVRKSKKFGIWVKKKREERSDNPVQSEALEIGQNCPKRSDKSVRNKEDHAVDHAVKQQPASSQTEDSVWQFLKVEPCGPSLFRSLLESRWASRNGGPYSILIGETVDAWRATEGENPPYCAPLFQALKELRRREARARERGGSAERNGDDIVHLEPWK
jgi:hypothetical protein